MAREKHRGHSRQARNTPGGGNCAVRCARWCSRRTICTRQLRSEPEGLPDHPHLQLRARCRGARLPLQLFLPVVPFRAALPDGRGQARVRLSGSVWLARCLTGFDRCDPDIRLRQLRAQHEPRSRVQAFVKQDFRRTPASRRCLYPVSRASPHACFSSAAPDVAMLSAVYDCGGRLRHALSSRVRKLPVLAAIRAR